jgi:hypothetical protein
MILKSITSIIARPKSALSNLVTLAARLGDIHRSFDQININQGLILTELHRNKKSKHLQDYEFRVFSQCGEDGILQRLINCIEIKTKTFIEFGVEDFYEASCRFLLMKDNWAGFVIDGSASNIARLKTSYFYWKHDLVAINAFITRENINSLLAQSGFDEDIGILSIDIDGNDYYVLEAIENYRPRILILEFNADFGPIRKISVPYEPDFVRNKKHYSNLYFGASLAAMTHIAAKKGYSLVGTNSASSNGFFVRNDLLNSELEVLSVEQAYSPALFRQSRDQKGEFTFVRAKDRLELMKGLRIFNVETNTLEWL